MGKNIFRAAKRQAKSSKSLQENAPPENFENVGSQIAGNCISGLMSNLILKLRLLVGDKRGPGYWKFNNSLVNNKLFVSQMNSKIEDYFHETMEISNPVIRWDFLKLKLRQFCMSYSKQKSRERKQK